MTREQILVVLGLIGCAVCVGFTFSATYIGFSQRPDIFAWAAAGAVLAIGAAWLVEVGE